MSVARAKIKSALLRRIRSEVPERPGVYRFHDDGGRIIYIGKSVNLRQRLASYFPKDIASFEDRIRRMIFNIADFTYFESESELQALLEEDRLIKEHMPYFNERQKDFPNYQYLFFTEDEFPALKMCRRIEDDNLKIIFGPFRDSFMVRSLLEIIYPVFRIRSCPDARPSGPCLKRDISFCSGPCEGGVTPDAYGKIVDEVAGFLRGDQTLVVRRLTGMMEKSAAALQFERAERLKDKVAFSLDFCAHQRFIERFKSGVIVLSENGRRPFVHIFVRGFGCSIAGESSEKKIDKRVRRLEQDYAGQTMDDRHLIDRANIVYRWVEGSKKQGASVRFL